MDFVVSLPTTTVSYNAVFIAMDRFLQLLKFTPCMATTSSAELAFIYGLDCIPLMHARKDHW